MNANFKSKFLDLVYGDGKSFVINVPKKYAKDILKLYFDGLTHSILEDIQKNIELISTAMDDENPERVMLQLQDIQKVFDKYKEVYQHAYDVVEGSTYLDCTSSKITMSLDKPIRSTEFNKKLKENSQKRRKKQAEIAKRLESKDKEGDV
jgi:hypothetical protein